MAPVRWASSEGSAGEKSNVGTLGMGIGSIGFCIVESATGSDFGGSFASTLLLEEGGGTGDFWDRHLTDRIRVRRGIDLARIVNILQTVGFKPKSLSMARKVVKFIFVYFQ